MSVFNPFFQISHLVSLFIVVPLCVYVRLYCRWWVIPSPVRAVLVNSWPHKAEGSQLSWQIQPSSFHAAWEKVPLQCWCGISVRLKAGVKATLRDHLSVWATHLSLPWPCRLAVRAGLPVGTDANSNVDTLFSEARCTHAEHLPQEAEGSYINGEPCDCLDDLHMRLRHFDRLFHPLYALWVFTTEAEWELVLIPLLYEFSSLWECVWEAEGASMAKPLLRIQRYFCRKPVRFFSLILLYLTAGSLVFLHSGFIGNSGPGARGGRDSVVASEAGGRGSSSDNQRLGIMSRVFKETRRSGRRFGPRWMRNSGQGGRDAVGRGGDYASSWNRALKGRNAKDIDDGRGKVKKTLLRCLLYISLI